jgi:hypothetical protein
MRRAVALLFFFLLAEDGTTLYSRYMFAPMLWMHPFLTGTTGLKIRGFDAAMVVIFALALQRRSLARGTVLPMRHTIYLAIGTTIAWYLFGVVRGGDSHAGTWQIYLTIAAMFCALTVSVVFTTYEHYLVLARAVLAAAAYRATMAILFWFFYIHDTWWETYPPHVTTHDDTVLWIVAIVMWLAWATGQGTRRARLWAMVAIPLLIFAIQLNHRRIAWVSLGAALAVFYALLPVGKIKRKINRTLTVTVPIVLLYVAVGWGRKEAIFKPLAPLATMSTNEDDSTKARNCENLGLIATAHDAGPILGTGYGHPYKELTNKYSIAGHFDLWPFIPHNSILGLLAYTGILGFAGVWLAFPTAMFLHARVARLAKEKHERSVGIVCAALQVVAANQMFGDMGLVSSPAMYLLAASYAVALRFPIVTGAWPAPALTARPAPAATVEQAAPDARDPEIA